MSTYRELVNYRESYMNLASDYEEICRDYDHICEEFNQQEEILDKIEGVLMSYLDEELARAIYNEIFEIKEQPKATLFYCILKQGEGI